MKSTKVLGLGVLLIASHFLVGCDGPSRETFSYNVCGYEFGTTNSQIATMEAATLIDKSEIPNLLGQYTDSKGKGFFDGQALLILCGTEQLPPGYFIYRDGYDNLVKVGYNNIDGSDPASTVGFKGSNGDFGFKMYNYPEDHNFNPLTEGRSTGVLDITFTRENNLVLKPGEQWTKTGGVKEIK
jgi:hypothetical protein